MRATLDAATGLKHDYTLICSGIGKAGAAAGVMNAVARASEPFEAVAVIGFAAGGEGKGEAERQQQTDDGSSHIASPLSFRYPSIVCRFFCRGAQYVFGK